MTRELQRLLRSAHFVEAAPGPPGGGAGGSGGAPPPGGPPGGGASSGAPGGTAGDPWYQPYVEKLAGDKDTLAWLDGKKFPDALTALKSGAQADKLVRDRNAMTRPEKGKELEWNGWAELGWNPDAAEYGKALKPPAMPDGQTYDTELWEAFTKAAHGSKALPQQAQAIFDSLNEVVGRRVEGVKAQGARASSDLEESLRKSWGAEYDGKREMAQRAAKLAAEKAGVNADKLTELEKLVGGPELMRMFEFFGSQLGEDRIVAGGGGRGTMSPGEAGAEFRRLSADAAFMKSLSDARHPQHADNKARMNKLIELEARGMRR